MYLGNPLLPIQLKEKRVASQIKQALNEKNRELDIPSPKLVLSPYFLFNYHYFTEKDEQGEKIVAESRDGLLALDGNSLKIDVDIAKLIKNGMKSTSNEIPELDFEEKETLVDKKQEANVLKFKTAEHFKISKSNVAISHAKKFFVPFYEYEITIGEKKFALIINVSDNPKKDSDIVIAGIDSVPIREKGIMEVTQETLEDLTKPEAWIDYSKGLLRETSNLFVSENGKPIAKEATQNTKVNASVLSSKWVLILIMLLALFIIYLAFA